MTGTVLPHLDESTIRDTSMARKNPAHLTSTAHFSAHLKEVRRGELIVKKSATSDSLEADSRHARKDVALVKGLMKPQKYQY